MASDRSRLALALVVGALIGACLDPLYADGDPLKQQYVVCCPAGVVGTCLCTDAATCAPEVFACPGTNRCSLSSSCTGTGGGTGAGGGTATGGGSTSTGGGASTGGGSASGGGGQPEDAGSSGGGAGGGGATGGGGGTTEDAGQPMDAGTPDTYEFCCAAGHLTTCVCPMSQCSAPPYTPCANATCVEGTASGQCH